MDWVKPKDRSRRQSNASEPLDTNSPSGTLEADITAGAWLNQLCEDNVALLQASLPVETKKSKRASAELTSEDYVRALNWGTGVWEASNESGHELLEEFVAAFGTKSRGKKKKAPAPLLPNQIATAKKVGQWITKQLPRASYDPYVALVSAGWIHALPQVGKEIPPTLWLDVLQAIMTQVNRAWEGGEKEDGIFPWVLWSCEIPLGLAKQLSHLGGKDRIVSDSLNRIAQLLEENADDPAPLLRFGGQDLRAVIACVLRSRWAADELGARKWFPPQRKGLIKLATYALALTDGNGRQNFFNEDNSEFDPEFWTAIHSYSGNNSKLANTMACALPDAVGKSLELKPSKLRKDKLLDTSLFKHSHYLASSSMATMRRSWRESGCRIAIDFSSDVIWLDVMAQDGSRVFSGDWEVHLKRDTQEVLIDHAWQELCWFSDDDVDYLELECSVGDECSIQRQIMLIREEGVIYFADALVAKEEHRWSLQSSWALAPNVRFDATSKNTEAKLWRESDDGEDESTVAILLPIAMPEWKATESRTNLVNRDDMVVQTTEGIADRIYSPLVMSLKGVDADPSYTWRQLTVAEDLAIQPRNVAEAYRVQIEKDQWVFYRSLAPCTRRTVMGLHLNTEFYTGRFSPEDGQFEVVMEVNPADEDAE